MLNANCCRGNILRDLDFVVSRSFMMKKSVNVTMHRKKKEASFHCFSVFFRKGLVFLEKDSMTLIQWMETLLLAHSLDELTL